MTNSKKPNLQVFCSEEGFDTKKVGDKITYDSIYFTNKPSGGGLWTSSFIPEEKRYEKQGVSDWAEWCLGECFRPQALEHVTLIYPNEDARVYEIDSLQDLYLASAPFFIAYPEYYSKMGLEDREFYKHKKVINFPDLFIYNDGVHITEKAAGEFHLLYDLKDRYPSEEEQFMLKGISDLNCYDCESTFWRDTSWIDHIEERVVDLSDM